MGGLLYPALYALFVWWFSTGIVLLLDNLPRRTFRWSMAAGTAILGVSLYQIAVTSAQSSETAAYAAFTFAILAWAWQEMSFFMGVVTGPRRVASPPGSSTAQRFRHGVAACLWHELAIIATALLILAATHGAPNQVGAWTFLLLWLMRTSAKLNVFLGVLNLGETFLPPHLKYLLSFMARRPMNPLMPVSLIGGTIGTVLLTQAALTASVQAQAAGFAMLATMMALATIEHALLVLPVPYERLWAWSLRFKPGVKRSQLSEPRTPRGASHGLPALLP